MRQEESVTSTKSQGKKKKSVDGRHVTKLFYTCLNSYGFLSTQFMRKYFGNLKAKCDPETELCVYDIIMCQPHLN